MHYSTKLIDILYNPARYYDHSWLSLPDKLTVDIDTLPACLVNYLILVQHSNLCILKTNIEKNKDIEFFINNWHKIKRAAYLIGLKFFSASLINHPVYMAELDNRERQFLCLPLPLLNKNAPDSTSQLTDSNITQVGALYIISVARKLLPSVLSEYLKLIFPASFSYEKASSMDFENSLSTLKWAFDYA
ncbi:hypothetical protein AC791_14450 [Klebsiella sp. RIT-PI-d]|uniref:hypothetical protein n=1 Tax=Klebsiella sp. RIT-PI-d TaxID=1681196 RepID=UPI00067621A0|nr:hypothetical protein [Klebsiella sp. RIT-PI-d]KNC09816.1 hypothetical protein AC791_14450 [Klebsiella sp. RIT-PI-d]